MQKPCKVLTIVFVLEPGAKAAIYEFDQYRLDPNLLRVHGAVVPLTPKAIQTLYLLVSRAPEVVTKEEIVQTVWPDTFVVESSLTRNVSVIRKALQDRSGGKPYIETLPKRGYRFTEPVKVVVENDIRAETASAAAATEALPRPGSNRRRFLVGAGAAGVVLAYAGTAVLDRGSSTSKSAVYPSTLIGWHLLHKFSPADLQQALTAFEQSVIADPKSASAQAGLAMALFTLSRLGGVGREVFGRAKTAAQSAVRLDPQSALAHVAQGTAYMTADWNIADAEKSYRRALALDSRCTLALVGLSQVLAATARLDEGLTAARQAASVDPVSPMIGVQLGMVLYSQHRFEDACLTFREVLHRERNFALAHYFLGLSSAYLGTYAEAKHHLSKSELHPGVLQTDFAWIELLQGNRAPAEKVYEQTQAAIRAGNVGVAACLLLAAWLGRFDDAFRTVEIAARERLPEILSLSSDPRLEPLRKHPRYTDALKHLPFNEHVGSRYSHELDGLDRVLSWSRRLVGYVRPGSL